MSDKQNRREFLARTARWAASAGLLGGATFPLLSESRASQGGLKILTRTLGKTGISLPVVSMGVMNADVPGLIRRAYEVGIRHFDTAARYQGGRNEEMVGAVIQEMGVRQSVVISTKVRVEPATRGTEARDAFRQTFEGSLKRLQMDYVDILYYHAVGTAEEAQAEEPLEALAQLKKEGRARFVGISTHQGAGVVLPAAARLGVFDVGLVAINYTMASDKDVLAAIDEAAKAGMGIVAMKTQAGGTARPDPKLPPLPPCSQTALLKWVLRNPSITTAIPGFTTYEQLEQNFSVASDLEYTGAEREFLGDKTLAAQSEFCRQCGSCRADCPRGADVPTLMRAHMYGLQYSNEDLARYTLASIKPGEGLDACRSCSTCAATCRNEVRIGRKIAHLKLSHLAAS